MKKPRIYAVRQRKMLLKRLAKIKSICAYCGKRFKMTRIPQQFCSTTCNGMSINTGAKKGKYLCVGKKLQHRIIMENHIGRKLFDYEVVHHINENKLDNRIENLQIMTKSEHMKHHALERHRNRKINFIKL